MREGETVTDSEGRQWRLGPLLGKGGEGDVYSVVGHPLAIKIRHKGDPECFQRRMRAVARLPLDDLPLARLQCMLAPPLPGYVMRLIDDAEPWQTLLARDRSVSAEDWLLRTGGLGRRLELLAQLAEALADLHGRGIVYRDLSYGNVLVSPIGEAPAIWLIDPDNLRFTTEPSRFAGTPQYAAPELNRRDIASPDTLCDAHSLAALAYHTLTTIHPLMGGDLVDEDDELRGPALMGEVPWVEHPTDTINSTSAGFPAHLVLTNRMLELAQRTFVAGLKDPTARATTAEWARALRAAVDLCLACPRCAHNYFAKAKACPWCGDPRPSFARLTFGIWCDAGLGLARKHELVIGVNQKQRLRPDLTHLVGADLSDAIGEVEYQDGSLQYRAIRSGSWIGAAKPERQLEPGDVERLEMKPGKALKRYIHFGPVEEPHRAVRLAMAAAG